MNTARLLPFLMVFYALYVQAQPREASVRPHLKTDGAVTRLMVDGKPFLMLAGELRNSSASSIEYMAPRWDRLKALNLNTVIGTVSWELVEPVEGTFDFTLVDAQIQEARRRDLRLVLIWFATWKNASSTYVPAWVKTDLERFPRIQDRAGFNTPVLTPLGKETLAADARAFRALMTHLRDVDPEHTVVMVQVENESGLLGDSRDWSALAEAAWAAPVPSALIKYLQQNRDRLLPETREVWGRNGFQTKGTWSQVFGTDVWAEEVFMAWFVGSYVGEVARAGKEELGLPMYANAWLGPQPGQPQPGGYPSGGPVARMMDIWRAAAPALDLLAPDIYVEDFKGACAEYQRSGNPLFIPEARVLAGNMFWAFGRHAVIGFSPFAIDDVPEDDHIRAAYAALRDLTPLLLETQPDNNVRGILLEKDSTWSIDLGGYTLHLQPTPAARQQLAAPPSDRSPYGPQGADRRPYGLVVATGRDEFLLVGTGFTFRFAPGPAGPKRVGFLSVDEGRFENGRWIPGRRLNGDEIYIPSLPDDRIGMLKIRVYGYD